jgi:UDPglucose 6-dehydrogenase
MGADPRIGRSFLMPGPGYGGSCFPKDVAALINVANSNSVHLRVLNGVDSANDYQVQHVTNKILNFFGSIDGKNIAVWGLTFKAGTDDIRASPAIDIVMSLLFRGARVRAHDPKGAEHFAREFGRQHNLTFAEDHFETLDDAHALVLVTDWPAYHRPDWEKAGALMRSKVVFDFRNLYSKADLASHGFRYESIGRP